MTSLYLIIRKFGKFFIPALIFLSGNYAEAIDLNRLFPQIIDKSFYDELQNNEGMERAVFIALNGSERVFYLRYTNKAFILRGNLFPEDEKLLSPAVFTSQATVFSPLKQDKEPLYRKGTAYTGTIFNKENLSIEFEYVPYRTGEKTNNAFVCDFGYLQINIKADPRTKKEQLKIAFEWLFAGNAKIIRRVKLNQYYLYRDNYWGPVEELKDNTSDSLIFYPLHKATLNKSISDPKEKTARDKQLVISLIAHDRFLYSQDMRLKLGMVPAFVKINWKHIDNTDIGSGQNQLVFLSIGPGINYFDDPWQQSRKNVPCPRLIFHRNTANLNRIQMYPTYSIEPEAIGVGRLAAINNFQPHNQNESDIYETVVWSNSRFKNMTLTALEDLLCRYGLTNDSPDLTPGFEFKNHFYKGNPVNNEIRIFQFAAVRDSLKAVLIPADTTIDYQNEYREKLANACRHWEYNCGIHFSRLFTEAIESTDKGFRTTWLMMQLKETHPILFRILADAKKQANKRSFIKIADTISRLISKTGRCFFLTPYFKHYRALDQKRNLLWLDYLEACRDKEERKAAELFSIYTDFYRYLEDVCE